MNRRALLRRTRTRGGAIRMDTTYDKIGNDDDTRESINGTVSLKFLVDKKCQRVLFVEAGKDFVDFLFSILSFPVGTVTRFLSKQDMVGCLGNLHDSFENLSETYIQPEADKDTLLNPATASNYTSTVTLLLPNLQSSTLSSGNIYRCGSNFSFGCITYFANDPRTKCPSCNNVMNTRATFVNPSMPPSSSSNEGGYVKGVVTYMITDDLVVRPMSSISCISLLNKFNVKDMGDLEERVIDVGTNEAKQLLKACLQSKTALTDVFLGKNVKVKVERSDVTDSPI